MTEETNITYTTEGRPLALIFLITFCALSLLLLGLLYGQIAQVLTRDGNCTVLSSQITSADIDSVGGETDGTVYYLNFHVVLQTATGQQMHVTSYYGSSDYDFGDQASAQRAQKQYAIGSTYACSYTYLDPSGTSAFFSPILPTEGIYFISALLLASLVLAVISGIYVRKRPAPSLALKPGELTEDEIDFGPEAQATKSIGTRP
jgi:hypothetical protein